MNKRSLNPMNLLEMLRCPWLKQFEGPKSRLWLKEAFTVAFTVVLGLRVKGLPGT